MNLNPKQIVRISKALSDENRYKMFRLIAQRGEISCTEITKEFSLSQPTISHHLKVLMESGLVVVRKEGQWSFFSVQKEALAQYLDSVAGHIIN